MTPDTFWKEFAAKHRPETTKNARVLASADLSEYEFGVLLANAVPLKMSPGRAKNIYRFLKKWGMLRGQNEAPPSGASETDRTDR